MNYRAWLVLSLYMLMSELIAACAMTQLLVSDALTTAMHSYAGTDSINCGVVPSGWSGEAANHCVDAAYHAKQAFTVRYNLPGIDSQLAEGLASNE